MKQTLKAMKSIAQAATPGPWRTSSYKTMNGENYMVHKEGEPPGMSLTTIAGKHEAEHIATFNPAAAIALIDNQIMLIEALEESVDALEYYARRPLMCSNAIPALAQSKEALAKAKQNLEKLEVENE